MIEPWVGPVAAGAVGAIVLGAVVAWATVARRRLRRDIQRVVNTLEDIRGGQARGRPETASDSPLVPVADAVSRLGHDLHARWSEADAAAERWRALTGATHDTAILTTDTDGDVRTFSPGATELFGWDEDEVQSRSAAVVFEESAYRELLPHLARRSVRQRGLTTRTTLLRRDGSSFPAEVTVRTLVGAESQPIGFMMVARDLSDQLRLENDLRDSERRYRGLVEGLAEGVLILRDGRVAYANPSGLRICGRDRDDLVGRPWRDLWATSDLLVVEEAIEEIARGRQSRAELRCDLASSEGGPGAAVRVSAAAVEFDGASSVLLLVVDETAERRMEDELRRNEARLDAVIEATSDGLLVLAGDGETRTVQLTNRAFAALFGFEVLELLGLEEPRLVERLGRRGDAGRELARRLAGGTDGSEATRIRLGEGEGAREIDVRVRPLVSRGGSRWGSIVACHEVTEHVHSQRQLQEQSEELQLGRVELLRSYRKLREANDDLQTRGEELDRLNAELRQLDAMKSDLLGNVSHELQTPLVSIRGYTEMVLKERLGPITDEQRKGLGLSLKNIDRMISMIDNLLAFARTDPDMGELELSRFDLGGLMVEAVELLRDQAESKSVDVAVEGDGGALNVEGDRDRLLQVMLNLLSNAIKFTPAGGRVVVESRRDAERKAVVSVRDNGVGIPDSALERIFERNYRVQSELGDDAEGSGIGLSIVRDILRLHGTAVDVRSEEGRGSEFRFSLPLVAEPPMAPELPPEPEPEPEPEQRSKPGSAARHRLRIIRRDRGNA